jgi:predicted transcriptional regulator of viral defense system
MKNMDKLKELISKQNGTVLSSDLVKYEIPRTYLTMMVAEGKLERVNRGVYTLSDAIEDEMYAMQGKYPKLIFSHETALFIHGLSDRTPFEYSATVPSGYKVVKSVSDRFKIYYIKKELHNLGVVERTTSFGNNVRVYCIERTLCDVLRSKSRIDIQIVSDAFKRAVKIQSLDYQLLIDYAKLMGIDKVVKTYMEVLL